MVSRRNSKLLDALASVAPGIPLREGLDRILQAQMGALVVVGDGPEVLNICSGGFLLDAAFSPQRLSELAKMDGAIILAADASRIARANVHLVPNPNVATSETGTRHRTAERVARSISVPVISVSEDQSVIAVYVNDEKHPLEPIPRLLARANQALSTLERYRHRLNEVTTRLGERELEDDVTLRDVCTVLQRSEMVRRIEREVGDHVAELGREGRLIELQRAELMSEVEEERVLIVEDYRGDRRRKLKSVLTDLDDLTSHDLLDLDAIAAALDHEPPRALDTSLQPRGYRLLARIPRLPSSIVDKLVSRFGTLSRILDASEEELMDIEGIAEARASSIKEGLTQLAATTSWDR